MQTTLLTNTSAQAESLLPSPEQTARGIGLYVKVSKTEFICFKQDGHISTLNGNPLKLVEQFTFLTSNISSTKSNVSICIGKT